MNPSSSSYNPSSMPLNAIHQPPYLAPHGSCAFIAIFFLGCASIACLYSNYTDFAAFLAAITSCLIAYLAFLYAQILMQWAALQNNAFQISVSEPTATCLTNTPFTLSAQADNELPFPIIIRHPEWKLSSKLSLRHLAETPSTFPSHSTTHFNLSLTAHRFGKSHIFGFSFCISDPDNIFNALTHQELNVTIAHSPIHNRSKNTKTSKEINLIQSALSMRNHHDSDIERIRPWNSADCCKQIFWRGLAKTRSLSSIQKESYETSNLICLIDAGPHMRISSDNKDCQLVQAAMLIAGLTPFFNASFLLAYDETGIQIISRNAPEKKIIKQLETWLFQELQWKPPLQNDPFQKENWAIAASELYWDFRRFKQVNFLKSSKTERKIDIKGLVKWARADWAAKEIALNNQDKAAKILNMPYDDLLIELIRKRCDMPDNRLSPYSPQNQMTEIHKVLKKWIKSSENAQLIWFSDFSSKFQPSPMNAIIHEIQKHHINATAVCLPPPINTLNYNPSDGLKNRQKTIALFDSSVKIMYSDEN